MQAPAPRQASRDLDDLRTLDPEFSVVLFEDFAYALYARAHEARTSERDLEALSPYLSPAARSHLAQRQPVGAAVSNVIVGAMRVVAVSVPPAANAAPGGPPPREVVTLEFEANMTAAGHTHYVEERWRLERDATVRSKPPETGALLPVPQLRRAVRAGGGRPLPVLRPGGLGRPLRLERRVDRPAPHGRAPAGPHLHRPGGGDELADDLPSHS